MSGLSVCTCSYCIWRSIYVVSWKFNLITWFSEKLCSTAVASEIQCERNTQFWNRFIIYKSREKEAKWGFWFSGKKHEYNDTALQTWSLHTCWDFVCQWVFLLVFSLVVVGFFPLNSGDWLVGAVPLQEKFWSNISIWDCCIAGSQTPETCGLRTWV